MKKFLVFVVVLSFLVPAVAFAKAEFSLGGFIKLDAFWDSTQAGKNMNGGYVRDNVGFANHGRTKFTAQGSRFNLTIKGPKLWGATTTGYLEMDFDSVERPLLGGATASNSYTPRLRHAMFRFNWPETELLFGQYWSMMSEWYAEMCEDGPFQLTGQPTARMAQVRLTQKFLGWGTAAILIGDAWNSTRAQSYSANDTTGQSGFMPQIQGKIQYQQDLYGKAAYYGKPIPLTVSLIAGIQRDFVQQQAVAMKTWGNNCYSNALAFTGTINHQTVYPWMIKGSVFVPVIPTHSANLAGTASVLATWYVGQGVESFGMAGVDNYYRFNNNNNGAFVYDLELQKRFGGVVQGQYYFTNQWFVTAAYAMSSRFGTNLYSRNAAARQAGVAANQLGFIYAVANAGDPVNTYQQAEVCVWYRPIQAFKFGLEYAYGNQSWEQITSAGQAAAPGNFVANPVNTSRANNSHRIEFVGFFYF
jgi:hypothetical protein